MATAITVPKSLPQFVRPPGLPLTCSDDQLLEAVKAYMCGATKDSLAPMLGVPAIAVAHWTDSREWGELVRLVTREVRGVLSGQLTRCASLSLKELADRLQHGEIVYQTSDDGETTTIRRALKAKELSTIAREVLEQQERLEKLLGNIRDDDDKVDLRKLAKSLENYARMGRDVTEESKRVPDAAHQ